MSYIEFHEYSKKLKGVEVLKNVNLQLKKGNVYLVKGPNGSGKTMLLRAICGLIRPSEGYVVVDGKRMGVDASFPESVGVVIESPGFYNRYTGFENLKILAEIKKEIGDEEIKKAMNRVGLNPDDLRTYKKYSLGMKQRLAIAQAIMEMPDILLLDEPTNALDRDGVSLVRQLIQEENQRGSTIVIASHNVDDFEDLANGVIEVFDGVCYEK